jgi:hypothetical protein
MRRGIAVLPGNAEVPRISLGLIDGDAKLFLERGEHGCLIHGQGAGIACQSQRPVQLEVGEAADIVRLRVSSLTPLWIFVM